MLLDPEEIVLQTADGHYVATVRPLFPIQFEQVVLWGERWFYYAYENIWQEFTPTVVTEAQ